MMRAFIENSGWRMMGLIDRVTNPRARAADQWVARLARDEPDDALLASFDEWVSDVRNEAAYVRASLVWQNVPAYHGARVPARQAKPGILWRQRYQFALAAALLLLASSFLIVNRTGERVYASSPHSIETVALADGSQLRLNAQTQVAVDLAERVRLVRLIKGEGYFDVAHDPARPFIVQAGGKTIRAVGTRFTVALANGLVRVAVIEGRVEVKNNALESRSRSFEAALVDAGQQVELTTGRPIVRLASASIDKTTAWQTGRLIFKNDMLQTAVGKINLYRERPIEIADPELQGMRISGSFDINDSEAFLKALNQIGGVAIVEKSDRAILVSVD